MSRLYIYDHCPFCIRTLIVAHYRQVSDLQQVVLLNDDEDSCHRLIGRKMVPIFEHQGITIAESMDIAKLLDELGEGPKALRPLQLGEAIQPRLQPVQAHSWALTYPRVTRIGMDTFATESACDYFRAKKEALLGCSFEQALAETDTHKAVIERVLAELPPLTLPSEQGDTLSWNDVLNFPPLQYLTLVDGLTFPPRLQQWLHEVAELGGVELYFERAV
ncbi:glutaredoxin 2 [Marinobacterium sediminicola]|uniref:Glutaredoxin 2 n=1 Tax=Marinobacterium sediminicola TaxID=518898 RepID=A0ABY1S1T2_9GAMM|nr:glutaredoxin 2 [Marinobacterium sediminicola]ULG69494.1 glutaredoxin 2 [Marinobacterium sediminicola]SMR75644.1 glutaredoxin 2 [Marinobacterium sediminicola]